jgi:HK97 gp10 family phage protein
MKIELQVRGIEDVLKTLQSMPPEVVSKRGGPVKSALRKAALVILKQERINLQAVISNATATGKKESTGLLLKSLVVTRGKAPTGGNGERYLVRFKRKTYPRDGKAKGKAVTTLQTAQLLEYGSSEQPAEPFIRPAFEAKAQEAIRTAQTELLAGVERIAKKLLKQSGGA